MQASGLSRPLLPFQSSPSQQTLGAALKPFERPDFLCTKRTKNQVLKQTLVVIDAGLENLPLLLSDLPPEAEVFLLDPSTDGLAQITEVLLRYSEISSLHLVCHGSPGCLHLGTTAFTIDTLHQRLDQFRIWAERLSQTTLFLYGCEVASGQTGQRFLQTLQHATGVAIAASTHQVGNAALGGKWQLDYRLGQVDGDIIFSSLVRQSYPGLLAPTIRFTASPTNLVESQGTVLTFRFELSESPPPAGVTVTVNGNRPQSLNNLDLFNISVTGGDFPVGDFDFTGFDFTIRSRVATITVPIFDNPEGTDPLYDGLRTVTYTLQSGSGYTPDSQFRSVVINYADFPNQLPAPTPTTPTQPPNPVRSRIEGTDTSERLGGTAAADIILGFAGNDTLVGRNGNDRLFGGEGNDRLRGGRGNDRLVGEEGNDRLFGNAGNDILNGGSGRDTLIGGRGRDTFILQKGEGFARIRDFREEDRLRLAGNLRLGSLTIEQRGRNTIIRQRNDILAVLIGVQSNTINNADFR